MVLIEGVKRAGRDLNGETLVSGLESIKDLDTGGLSPSFFYGLKRRKGTDAGRFYRSDIEKGHFVPITGWMKPTY